MKQSFRHNFACGCYNMESVFDEYTRHRLLYAAHFRHTLTQEGVTANWLIAISDNRRYQWVVLMDFRNAINLILKIASFNLWTMFNRRLSYQLYTAFENNLVSLLYLAYSLSTIRRPLSVIRLTSSTIMSPWLIMRRIWLASHRSLRILATISDQCSIRSTFD